MKTLQSVTMYLDSVFGTVVVCMLDQTEQQRVLFSEQEPGVPLVPSGYLIELPLGIE